ncbi:hypothetical protein ABIB38_003122 [Massilia sp. UYP11]
MAILRAIPVLHMFPTDIIVDVFKKMPQTEASAAKGQRG